MSTTTDKAGKTGTGWTPGPWAREGLVIWSPAEAAVVAIASALRPESGTVEYKPAKISDPDFREISANAALIAQAPEMAEMLRTLVDCWGVGGAGMDVFMAEARALLLKVEGK